MHKGQVIHNLLEATTGISFFELAFYIAELPADQEECLPHQRSAVWQCLAEICMVGARHCPDRSCRDAKSGRCGRYICAIFSAGANFWAILAILGHFLAILGNFWAIWQNMHLCSAIYIAFCNSAKLVVSCKRATLPSFLPMQELAPPRCGVQVTAIAFFRRTSVFTISWTIRTWF